MHLAVLGMSPKTLMLQKISNAFVFGLHEFTMVRSEGLSMASGLVIDSNVSQIPMSNPP